MYTLYLDTHNTKIIIILYKNKKVLIKKEIESNYNHSVTTMPILIETLEEAEISVNDLNEIIVVNGPGSFTGVRLGVTIAKTLAYTLDIPIKVMSSLLIKAVSFSHETINIVEKEKNGVFIGTFDKGNNLVKEYTYLKNSEYVPSLSDLEDIEINYEKIIEYASKLDSINPHAVNPLYVKKIEVQK